MSIKKNTTPMLAYIEVVSNNVKKNPMVFELC